MTLDQTSQFFKALSEPLRLRILHLLMLRPSLCVCDLVAILAQGQSTISRHLTYLKNAELVTSWREGTWMHYQLNRKLQSPMNLDTLEPFFSQLPECEADRSALEGYETIQPRQCQLDPPTPKTS